VNEAKAVLSELTAARLFEIRTIQNSDIACLAAIFSSVPHFWGHTQEIIHMTRMQLGDSYKIAWKPGPTRTG